MKYDKEYSKVTNVKDLPQSYDNAVWIQLERCMFFGSQDTTNCGVMTIQDFDGNTQEIVRYNFVSAFIHAVELLYFLVKLKHDDLTDLNFDSDINKADNAAYRGARENLSTILRYINKSGLFGYNTFIEYYGGEEVEERATKEGDRRRAAAKPKGGELEHTENE